MRGLAESGMTMVVVTHEMGFAREVGDTLVFMDDGVVVEAGDPRQVLTDPQHERTRSFLSKVLLEARHDGDAGLPADLGQRGAGVVQGELAGDQPARVEPAGGDQAEQLRIGVRGHAVAAEHLQLQGDHPLHRHLGPALRRRQQADLHVPARAGAGCGPSSRR